MTVSIRKRGGLRWVGLLVGIVLVGGLVALSPLPRVLEKLWSPKPKDVVARVGNREITEGQVDRAIRERLWREARTLEAMTPEGMKAERRAALEELIDEELLTAKADAADIRLEDKDLAERWMRFVKRFGSKEEMIAAAKAQGIDGESELRERLAAEIRRERFLEGKIGPVSDVSDDEARKWFEGNSKSLEIPERAEVRHVFLATLDHPSEEAKAKLEAALAELTAGRKDFATLAREISEDEATKNTGGSLGWMSRERLPADFEAPVFALPLNKPTLVRTRLGWHLLEVTGRKPPEARNFEQAKPEVLATLRTMKREKALEDYRETLRKNEAGRIEVFEAP